MRGSSTAKITFENGHVRKLDTQITGVRVRDQGIWLRRYDESLCLPAVNEIYADGYLMEKLVEEDLPLEYGDTLEMCRKILQVLAKHLWDFTSDDIIVRHIPFNRDFDDYEASYRNVHRSYVAGLLRDVDMSFLRRQLRRFEESIRWKYLRTGLTHGDPLIDNVLYRPSNTQWAIDRQLVLIDPIPACPAIPDVLAVDVGRVIQSAAGYEAFRYGDLDFYRSWSAFDFTNRTHDAVSFVLNDFMQDEFTLDDARASVYLAIIHQLRGVRTAQRVVTDRVELLKTSVIHLAEEAELWMR